MVSSDAVRVARRACKVQKRAPKGPWHGAAGRWRGRVRKKHKLSNVDIAMFLSRNLQPQANTMPAAYKKAALLPRIRAKEAALRGMALLVAV